MTDNTRRIDRIEFQKDINGYFRELPKEPFLVYDGSLENPLHLDEPGKYKMYNGLSKIDTLVVKVGTSIVTRDDSDEEEYNMTAIAQDLTSFRKRGLNVLLITSGAIGRGRKSRILDGEVIPEETSDTIQQIQRDAILGQPIIMNSWWEKFRLWCNQEVKDYLVINEQFTDESKKSRLLSRYQRAIERGIIPIINENDALSISEIETELHGNKVFRDNDGLAGLHAEMLKEVGYNPLLILLSNTDGIYTSESFASGKYEPIRIVKNAIGLENGISPESSTRGRGGVLSKIEVGRELAEKGIITVVANGQYCNHNKSYDVLDAIMQGKVAGTRFVAR